MLLMNSTHMGVTVTVTVTVTGLPQARASRSRGVAKAIQRDERTHSARVRALDELTGAPDHAVVTRAQGIESQITRTSNICIPISIYRPQGRAS